MNFYHILGISPTASHDQVEAAYRSIDQKNLPFEKQLEVCMAYSVLSDKERRAAFDAERRSAPAAPAPIIHQYYHAPSPQLTIPYWLISGIVWFIMAAATVMLLFIITLWE